MKTKKQKYWYLVETWECPVCGRESLRVRCRVYKREDGGYKTHNSYDYCLE